MQTEILPKDNHSNTAENNGHKNRNVSKIRR